MQRTLMLATFLWFAPLANASLNFTAGTGLETRIQREVNPDYAEVKTVGQLFAQMQFTNFAEANKFLRREYREGWSLS